MNRSRGHPRDTYIYIIVSFRAERTGADTVFCLKRPIEAGVIGESATGTDLPSRFPGGKELPRHQQTLNHDVAVDTDAHLPAESVG